MLRIPPLARLLASAACLAIVWLVLLPRVAEWGPVRARVELYEAKQVDPLAFRYTDLHEIPAAEAAMRQARARGGW